jgi:hypothetical protein
MDVLESNTTDRVMEPLPRHSKNPTLLPGP